MAARASSPTCCITNCIDACCRAPGGPISVGTPANVATSASPVQSTDHTPAHGPRTALGGQHQGLDAIAVEHDIGHHRACNRRSMRSSSPIQASARRFTRQGTYKKTAVSLNAIGPVPEPSATTRVGHLAGDAAATQSKVPGPSRRNSPQSAHRHGGEVAAQGGVTLDEHHRGPGAGHGPRRGQPGRPPTGHDGIHARQHRGLSGRQTEVAGRAHRGPGA